MKLETKYKNSNPHEFLSFGLQITTQIQLLKTVFGIFKWIITREFRGIYMSSFVLVYSCSYLERLRIMSVVMELYNRVSSTKNKIIIIKGAMHILPMKIHIANINTFEWISIFQGKSDNWFWYAVYIFQCMPCCIQALCVSDNVTSRKMHLLKLFLTQDDFFFYIYLKFNMIFLYCKFGGLFHLFIEKKKK